MLCGIELYLLQNLIYWLPPTAILEKSLRAIWDAASRAAVLILSPVKLNLPLSSCTSFLVNSYCHHEGTQSGLPSFNWTPWGTRALVPAAAPCAHSWGVQTNLECDSCLVKFWFAFVLFVWLECTDIWYKLLKLMWELLTIRFHTPPGNPLGKKIFLDWSIYSYDPVTRKIA